MSNSSIKIAQMAERIGIEDSDLLIVEDTDDTKKASVRELKKNLSGDYSNPDEYKFYSSAKIAKILQDIERLIGNKASNVDLKSIENRLADIVASSGDDISEIVDARDGAVSLNNRLRRDLNLIDEMYVKKLNRVITGTEISLFDHTGNIHLSVVSKESNIGSGSDEIKTNIGTILITGRNIINDNQNNTVVSKDGDSLIIKPDFSTNAVIANIELSKVYPAGVYYISCNANIGSVYGSEVILGIEYSDGTMDRVTYNFASSFKFDARKSLLSVKIIFPQESAEVYDGNTLQLRNFQITKDVDVDHYCTPYNTLINSVSGDYTLDYYNDEYEYVLSTADNSYELRIEYYDSQFDAEYIYNALVDIYNTLNDKTEYCGLITDHGYRQNFVNTVISSYPLSCTLEDAGYDMIRNGVKSKKLHINKNAISNPSIIQSLDAVIDNIDTVALTFYIDRTVTNEFTDRDGIRVHLSSDPLDAAMANYYTYIIKKTEMVQGWNVCKRKLSDFSTYGNPDPHAIKSVTIEIGRNDNLNDLSIYFNSITFNQKMIPTILLSFNGFYANSSLEYTYPYLTARGIPATVFINNRNTLNASVVDSLIGLRIKNGWDFGQYGCNPNKEYLQYDDNFRNQYVSLRNTREWVRSNLVDDVVSYAAPQGILRPITVPLLKDLGLKIATAQGNGYCAEFTNKDFVLPMHLISRDTPVDDIKALIDYAVETNQCLPLFTNDVTQYGDEQSATKVIFETIINYIIELRDAGKLQCLTYKEFYKRCVER